MRMPTDKELWRTGINSATDGSIVIAGISPDMFHQYIHILTFKPKNLWIHQSQVTTVTVTTYCPQRSECGQSLCHFRGTNITVMPYLITLFEVMQIFIIP